MTELRMLLDHFWITREYDKEMYFQVKRALPSLRRFLDELTGWRVIMNEKLIKLEKIPVKGESYMGIKLFQEPRDYMLLCGLLIYLEDLDEGEQFLLSELISTLETFLSEFMDVDWTQYTQRKSLVRMLKFAQSVHILVSYEGSLDSLSSTLEHEILYETTSLSRYFATHFMRDITDVKDVSDLEKLQNADLDETRGYARTNRVYRQLTLTPAMYWESVDDPDSLYLRNQRQWVQKYMDEALGGRLQIHKNAAFFTLEEDIFGRQHPKDGMLPEVVLLFCERLRDQIVKGKMKRDGVDIVRISVDKFQKQLLRCRQENYEGFSKEYREMNDEKLVSEVVSYMKEWKMIVQYEDEIAIYPAAGKFIGVYPQQFMDTYGK